MAGENNNLPVRTYQKQFSQLLQAVYRKQAYFGDFFGGGLQALDGVENNKTAFSVKTSDIPVVVGAAYNKDANVAFGTGTSNTTRFGPRTEIIYTDQDVPFTWEWVLHEGIDRYTVNNNFQAAVADRLDLQAQAKTQLFDDHGGQFISGVATEIKTAGMTSVIDLFNVLAKTYVNLEAIGTLQAWVKPELYNAIVDDPLVTTAKNSAVSIDQNGIVTIKGFRIKEVPDQKFQEGELAYVSVLGVGKQFTGIVTTRTIETPDFDGVALQGAGKAGEYILPANKKAVFKVTGDIPNKPDAATNGGTGK